MYYLCSGAFYIFADSYACTHQTFLLVLLTLNLKARTLLKHFIETLPVILSISIDRFLVRHDKIYRIICTNTCLHNIDIQIISLK